MKKILTYPCLSEILFVSFSLWNETDFCIQCSPVAGESGWMYILFGISGSALPATIHLELWNLYLQSSTGTMSIRRIYFALLSSPDSFVLYAGNILLQTIIIHYTMLLAFTHSNYIFLILFCLSTNVKIFGCFVIYSGYVWTKRFVSHF